MQRSIGTESSHGRIDDSQSIRLGGGQGQQRGAAGTTTDARIGAARRESRVELPRTAALTRPTSRTKPQTALPEDASVRRLASTCSVVVMAVDRQTHTR